MRRPMSAGLSLTLDQAVVDRVGDREEAAPPGVTPDLGYLTAGHLSQPGIEGLEHRPGLLLLRGHLRDCAAEIHPRLRQRENSVRVSAPVTASGEHAKRGTAEPASHVAEHGNADHIE